MPLKFHRNEKKIHLQNIIISFLIKRILHRFKNYYKGDTSERLKRSTFANESQNEKYKRITGKHNFVLKIFILLLLFFFFFFKSIEFLSTIQSHVWALLLWVIFIRIVHFYDPVIFEIWKKIWKNHCWYEWLSVSILYQWFFQKHEKFFYRLKGKRDWNIKNWKIVVTLTRCWQCAAI